MTRIELAVREGILEVAINAIRTGDQLPVEGEGI
jgi:hypothetical protein